MSDTPKPDAGWSPTMHVYDGDTKVCLDDCAAPPPHWDGARPPRECVTCRSSGCPDNYNCAIHGRESPKPEAGAAPAEGEALDLDYIAQAFNVGLPHTDECSYVRACHAAHQGYGPEPDLAACNCVRNHAVRLLAAARENATLRKRVDELAADLDAGAAAWSTAAHENQRAEQAEAALAEERKAREAARNTLAALLSGLKNEPYESTSKNERRMYGVGVAAWTMNQELATERQRREAAEARLALETAALEQACISLGEAEAVRVATERAIKAEAEVARLTASQAEAVQRAVEEFRERALAVVRARCECGNAMRHSCLACWAADCVSVLPLTPPGAGKETK